jgi:hypothetical protein
MNNQISYDDFKKLADLCIYRKKYQHTEDFSFSAKIFLLPEYEVFRADYRKALSQGDLQVMEEITQQSQNLVKLWADASYIDI